MKKRLLLAVNPASGRGKGRTGLFDIADAFSARGYSVTLLPTRPFGQTVTDVAEACPEHDIVVAVGGDGTLNEVANGIMNSEADIPLGYIPLGSTNDFAASLGLPKRISDSVAMISEREPQAIDIGKFGNRYFMYIACTGVFTEASYKTSRQMKNAFGHSAYILKGLTTLSLDYSASLKVITEDETIEDDFVFVSVSNSLRAGGVFRLDESEVSFDDGLFELTLAPAPKTIADSTMLVNDVINMGLSSTRLIHRKIRSCRFVCREPQSWSVDGESGGNRSDIGIEVRRRALRFVR